MSSFRNPGLPVPPECEAARERLLDHIEPRGENGAEPPSFHCEACRAWFASARVQARMLVSLPRQRTDWTSLDGLVVAGLNAGRRQERAVLALASLERFAAPERLSELLDERLGRTVRSAPRELDQRVADELRAGAGVRAGRHIGSLARMTAPAELDVLVARRLARSTRVLRIPRAGWIAAAAGLAVLVGAASIARWAGLFTRDPYPFRVVHTAKLDGFARSQLYGAAGFVEVPQPSTRIQPQEKAR